MEYDHHFWWCLSPCTKSKVPVLNSNSCVVNLSAARRMFEHVRTNVQRTGRGYLQCYKRYVISHKILSNIPIRSLSQSDACCKHGIIQVCFNSLIQANLTPLPPQEVQQEVHPCIAMNKRNSSNPSRFCALCSKCAEFIPLFYVDGPHWCDG